MRTGATSLTMSLMSRTTRLTAAGLVAVGAVDLVGHVFRYVETSDRIALALRWDSSPAALRLRSRAWLASAASLLGLAGAIRYAYVAADRPGAGFRSGAGSATEAVPPAARVATPVTARSPRLSPAA